MSEQHTEILPLLQVIVPSLLAIEVLLSLVVSAPPSRFGSSLQAQIDHHGTTAGSGPNNAHMASTLDLTLSSLRMSASMLLHTQVPCAVGGRKYGLGDEAHTDARGQRVGGRGRGRTLAARLKRKLYVLLHC